MRSEAEAAAAAAVDARFPTTKTPRRPAVAAAVHTNTSIEK